MTISSLPESIELFLFDFCPYAQRVQISLIQSQLPYQAIVLDPDNIPEDFSAISPLGNVPVLRINHTETVFESAIINDYIAQISPISMEPEDELQRAQMRAWNEYAGNCMGALMQVLQAPDKDSFEKANKTLINKFQPLSEQLSTQGAFFNGSQWMTIDATYAPLFLRMKTLSDLFDEFLLDELPENIQHWMFSLLESAALKKSIIGNFPTVYRRFVSRKTNGKYVDGKINLN